MEGCCSKRSGVISTVGSGYGGLGSRVVYTHFAIALEVSAMKRLSREIDNVARVHVVREA